MSAEPATTKPSAVCAVSGHLDTRTAATEIAHELHDAVGASCDLVIVFASFHHRAALPEAMQTIRQTIGPSTSMATTAEAVLGPSKAFEGVAGMTAIAMQLPGVVVTPWVTTPDAPMPLGTAPEVAARIRLTHDFRCAVLIGDPFSTPIATLLPAVTACGGRQLVPVVGGMASGASQPGCNVLVLDDRVFPAGAIGVSLAGDIDVDVVVSQGCRPIGSPFVVTQVKDNIVLELGGRPALAVLKDLATSIDEDQRQMLNRGLLLGTVINEHKRPFGRGDFLVRNVLGFEQKKSGIVVGDVPRPGQTVQFHARDAVTASEDLQLLLDAQQLKGPPFGALLFSCNSRGRRLYDQSEHDLALIQERLGPVPMAGFFAAGEIGPVGDKSFLHGHTAVLAMLRNASPAV